MHQGVFRVGENLEFLLKDVHKWVKNPNIKCRIISMLRAKKDSVAHLSVPHCRLATLVESLAFWRLDHISCQTGRSIEPVFHFAYFPGFHHHYYRRCQCRKSGSIERPFCHFVWQCPYNIRWVDQPGDQKAIRTFWRRGECIRR